MRLVLSLSLLVLSGPSFAAQVDDRAAVALARQPIDSNATDILRVAGDRIRDTWHLEDNLTPLRQAGLLRDVEG